MIRFNRQGFTLLLLGLCCLLLGPWYESAMADFGLVRSGLSDGEYWRFFSGPLVHAGWAHLGLNIAALLLLQQLFGQEARPVVWAWGYAVIAIAVGICLLAFSRFGSVYGLSGVLHGLYVYLACLALGRDALLGAGVLLLIAAKVGWEQLAGGSHFVERLIDLPVATDAHLYGAIAGAVLGAAMASSRRANDA